MLKIELELADNGVIKTATDDNYNGAGQLYEQKKLYVLEDDNTRYFESTIKLLDDILIDMGIDTGGKKDQVTLSLGVDWGNEYIPTLEEVEERINIIDEELKNLNAIKDKISKRKNTT